MREGSNNDLAIYRLAIAKDCIKTARRDLENNDYKASTNRSYYAIFHCMRALFALKGVDFKRHSGIIAHFHKEYIKTRIFDIEFAEIINMAFFIRNKSDYDDFYIIFKADVEQQLSNAERFLHTVQNYINNMMEPEQ